MNQPATFLDEIPVFEVRPEGMFYYPRDKNGNREQGCHLVFTCPTCGVENVHGGAYGNPGAGDGHRVSHCQCWPRGYYICELKP
jgi:hypothetical protein